MDLKVKEHGRWEIYRPEKTPPKIPETLMSITVFCRRVDDHKDWYDYSQSNEFEADTIKMTVYDMGSYLQVQAVTRDVSMLCPQNSLVLEVWGIDDADPQKTYGQRQYLRDKGEFGRVPPPPVLTRMQFYMQLVHDGTISEDEAIAAMGGAIPATLSQAVATLPSSQQFGCKMMLASPSVMRSDPNFINFATAMSWSEDKVFDFFEAAWRL